MTEGHGPGLVGREHELAQLDAALDDALAGRGRLVLLTGEAGIGKTALARAFVERAAARDTGWAWGTCWEGGGAPPYWPWVQIVRALARSSGAGSLTELLGDGAPWLASLLPELRDTPAAAQPPLDPGDARFRLFDALAGLLTSASGRRPLVVVLDDLHWSDAASLHALEFVASALPDMRVLAIAAYRHVEAHARAELGAPLGGLARVATRLPLEGLDREDVGRLAAGRARGLDTGDPRDIPAPVLTAVHEASAGNPFYVDELVQLLAREGRLYDVCALERPLPLPDGVRDAIRRRLVPLDEETVEVLSAASVIGSRFRLATLASVLDRPPADVLRRLEPPLRAGIVVAGGDPGSFGFQHELVRETLLESLGATRRARLHRMTAEALEALETHDQEPRLAEIADHFLHAATDGGAERGVDYAARAARQAIGRYAYEEAARLYERALAVAASLPADEARACALQQGRGEALMRAGALAAAQSALRAAAEHARRLEDPRRLAEAALASTLGSLSPGLVEPDLVALLEEALARLDASRRGDEDDMVIDALRCRVRVQLALALYWSPQRARRELLVNEALVLARAIFTSEAASASRAQRDLADSTLAFALAQGFLAVWDPDNVTRGLPISIEVLELCERTSDHELAMQVRLWRISLLLELDDPVRAEEEVETFLASARRLGQPRMLVHDPLHRALNAYLRGDFEAADRCTADAAAQARELAGSIAPIVADAQTFAVRRAQGRLRDVEPLVRKNADSLPAMRRWRCGLALVLAELGREDEARRELEQLAANDFDDIPRDALWLVAMALLAELCALLDDRPRAMRLYELLAPYEGRNVVSLGAVYLGPVARYLGLLAMTAGETERALGHLETARSAAERMHARPAIVLTALDTAEALARRGAPSHAMRARALVDGVRHDAATLQMTGALAHAEQLQARLERYAGPVAGVAVGAGAPRRVTLRREQDAWRLDYGQRSAVLPDAKGLHQLAVLLASPGRSIAAVALAGGDAHGPAVADIEAQRARADELREALEEARMFNDPERIAGVTQEMASLVAELSDGPGESGPAAERARVNVTRAIRTAIGHIAEQEPELGHLLQGAIRTGSSCAYEPDPGASLEWEVRL